MPEAETQGPKQDWSTHAFCSNDNNTQIFDYSYFSFMKLVFVHVHAKQLLEPYKLFMICLLSKFYYYYYYFYYKAIV